MTDKRILITGGAGFIGGNFVARALDLELGQVLVLDKFTYAGHEATLRQWEDHLNYELVRGDICDSDLVANILKDFHPTWLVHFAAESHVDRSIDSAANFIQTNIVGTFNLLEQCLSYWRTLDREDAAGFRFHHVSTDEVYGSLGATGYFTETTPYAPNSPYAASKAGSDHLVRAYHHTHKLPVTISNCSNNYGPFQFPEKLMPLVLLNALEGKPVPVYGDGQNVRDWLYVGDHCDAILQILAHGSKGETYNVGGHCEKTNLELIYALFEALTRHSELVAKAGFSPRDDYRELITFVTDRPGHDRRYAIDASRIERELGWRPATAFTDGLDQTVSWYLHNLDWCREVQQDNYERSRLGLAAEQ